MQITNRKFNEKPIKLLLPQKLILIQLKIIAFALDNLPNWSINKHHSFKWFLNPALIQLNISLILPY